MTFKDWEKFWQKKFMLTIRCIKLIYNVLQCKKYTHVYLIETAYVLQSILSPIRRQRGNRGFADPHFPPSKSKTFISRYFDWTVTICMCNVIILTIKIGISVKLPLLKSDWSQIERLCYITGGIPLLLKNTDTGPVSIHRIFVDETRAKINIIN